MNKGHSTVLFLATAINMALFYTDLGALVAILLLFSGDPDPCPDPCIKVTDMAAYHKITES